MLLINIKEKRSKGMKRGKLFKKLTAVTLTLATVLGMMSFTGCKSGTSTGSVST